MGSDNIMELKLNGKVNVVGTDVTEIAGGFGKDRKSMLAKDIAGLHNKGLDVVNRSINRNRNRFIDGVDVVDLKDNNFVTNLVSNEILTQNAVNRANNVYLLSQRGYAKLVKIFEDDLSWELYDKILDGYFEMKEQSKENSKSMTNKEYELEMLKAINVSLGMVLPALEEAGLQGNYKVLTMKGFYDKANVSFPTQSLIAEKELFSLTDIATKVGVYSTSNKPHSQAVGVILSMLSIDDSEKEIVSYDNKGHMGTTIQYAESVIEKVRQWLKDNSNPSRIQGLKKGYNVVYK